LRAPNGNWCICLFALLLIIWGLVLQKSDGLNFLNYFRFDREWQGVTVWLNYLGISLTHIKRAALYVFQKANLCIYRSAINLEVIFRLKIQLGREMNVEIHLYTPTQVIFLLTLLSSPRIQTIEYSNNWIHFSNITCMLLVNDFESIKGTDECSIVSR